MARLAEQIGQNHQEAAATQQAIRNNRRVISRRPAEDEGDEVEVGPVVSHELGSGAESITLNPIQRSNSSRAVVIASKEILALTVSPLDLPAEQFSAGLDRRKANRKILLEWLKTALVDGVDYGRIHMVSRDRCQYASTGRVKECPNQYHWSKPNLFKPGAEKITGMLGLTVHYPSLPAYETAILSQVEIKTVLMRCELRDSQGRVVAEGVGARSLAQDYGDLNKSLKMAEKSALADVILRAAGLSEIFTQDLEDRSPIEEEAKAEPRPVPKPVVANPKPKPIPEPEPEPEPIVPRKRGRPRKTPLVVETAAEAEAKPQTETEEDLEPAEEIVGREDVAAVRERIREFGFTEKRVLAWLFKSTQGTVTELAQLTIAQCVSLLKKLEQWAEAENENQNNAT